MAVSKSLQRLLHIRDLQEEQHRMALESAAAQLRELEAARHAAAERERAGRAFVAASVQSGVLADRQGGLVQAAVAGRHAELLAQYIARAEIEMKRLHQSFLEKRLERRQAETLVNESEARSVVESNRHSQRALDDWHGSRKQREKSGR
jgi:ABC-type Zn uptake system ZnuABC Zn-binding protein ZnuA